MQVKIRQLRALDAIVRLGSFVEAARALHVTPAALSLSIRELEAGLGFAVLERTTRSVRLSEAGRGYLPFAQRVLTELEDADRYAREVQQGHNVVRIATTQTIIGSLLAAALPDVHSLWPGIRIHPLDVATINIPDSVLNRQADMAIGVRLDATDTVDVQSFFSSHWFAYVGRSHPLAKRKRLQWSELGEHRLFMNKSSYFSLRLVLGEEAPFDNVHDIPTAISGLAMASTGIGIGVFPGYVTPFGAISGVGRVPLEGPRIPHELQIAVARQPGTAAPLHEIRDVFIRAVQQRCAHLK